MSDFYTNAYNPDVLSCLANLSNDEVFTPPDIVNRMLDMLPQELFNNKNATFLDPACKSGVFLREIAKRLLTGIEDEIPNLKKRINHIFHKQLFGIAITEMTSLLSRRSVYCSKYPNGKYSISTFDNVEGNIRFKKIKHNWKDEKCTFCGASKSEYDRDEKLETHAYEFIHTTKPEEIFNMKFDVIIGNPPYQLSDGGGMGSSAVPLYHKFVEQAIKLKPRYLSMIIPARWYSGGKGLDTFRNEMLTDNHIRIITDYFNAEDCFPGVDISGGVCFFLWDRDNQGECDVISIRGNTQNKMQRPLLEQSTNTFIRFNESIAIFRKINEKGELRFSEEISPRRPFGLSSSVNSKSTEAFGTVKVFAYPNNGFISRKEINRNEEWIDQYKVFIAKAYGERGDFPYLVTAKPFIGEPNTCCSETYLVAKLCKDKQEAKNVISYMITRFFRFLVLLKKNTQNTSRDVYSLIPLQDFSELWTDEKLYKKYDITKNEIAFIESMIRPMEILNE